MRSAILMIVFFGCFQGFAQHKANPVGKLAGNLLDQLARKGLDSLDVIISVAHPRFLQSNRHKMRVNYRDAFSESAIVRIHREDMQTLLNNDTLLFAASMITPVEELTTGAADLSLNRLNLAHHQYPHITGKDIRNCKSEFDFHRM